MSSTRSRPYYGWMIVMALSLTETTSWGILYYGFSVFLPAIEQEMGWTRAQTTGAFSLALLLSGLMAIPVGRWLDRHGACTDDGRLSRRLRAGVGLVAGSRSGRILSHLGRHRPGDGRRPLRSGIRGGCALV